MAKLGTRVRTVQSLLALSMRRRSVICPKAHCFANPIPAAVMINMQGRILARLLTQGMYVYEPKNRRK